jgi:hypothetical protein
LINAGETISSGILRRFVSRALFDWRLFQWFAGEEIKLFRI